MLVIGRLDRCRTSYGRMSGLAEINNLSGASHENWRKGQPGIKTIALRLLFLSLMIVLLTGCEKKQKISDDQRREMLDADFSAAMRAAGKMRRGNRDRAMVLTQAFQPFVNKHSLVVFENYFENRFGLSAAPNGKGKGQLIQGYQLLRLDWRFYYRDRIIFGFDYFSSSAEPVSFDVRVVYIPWIHP